MRAILQGQEHILLGEISPRDIHDLYVPDLLIPTILETYRGEVADIYWANGRVAIGGILTTPNVSVKKALGMLAGSMNIASRGDALVGPYLFSASNASCTFSPGKYSGIGLWRI